MFTTRSGSVLVHEPAELDEQPVRVGVLQELLHPGEKAQNFF